MYILFAVIVLIIIGFGVFLFLQNRRFNADLANRESEMKRRMYELAILKEIGDRAGYSLNVENIIDIISGSLHQFIEYSVVSYMFLEPEKIIFKSHIERSVSRNFFDDVKQRMLKSLSALLDKDFSESSIDEILSGAILVEGSDEPVRSFFNIPLVIADKAVGVLTIAHAKAGLYKEEEMTILYKIVKQASNAVTRLQEVVRLEQRKLNAMVESMTEGVVMTDKDYRIMVANPIAKRNLGIAENKEVSIFDFIDSLESNFDIREKLEESVKLDKVSVTNDVLINDKFFQITTLPVKSKFGTDNENMLGGVVIFHDITHEKEVEKMRDDFTSMIAHELRAPLDQIRRIVEVLKEDKLEKSARDEYLRMIDQGSYGLLSLVNNLLDMAKLEAGKFTIFRQMEDIRKIIEERVNFFKTAAKEQDVELLPQFDRKLPGKINFDIFKISQVFNNLISNGLKFVPKGGRIIVQAFLHKKGNEIIKEAGKAGILWNVQEVDIPDSGDFIVVAVTDSGIGISRDNIKKLFNKFKQIGNQKKGSGLGLVISKGIVEAHGGIIRAASCEGEGSTFYFTIPIENENKRELGHE